METTVDRLREQFARDSEQTRGKELILEEDQRIAKRMLADNLDLATIKKYTGLEDNKISRLIQSINTMPDATVSGSTNIADAGNQEFGQFAHSSRALRSSSRR